MMVLMDRPFFRFCQKAGGIFLGFTFWSSGMAKLYHEHLFIGWIGPVWLVERLEEYNLALYAQFIACSQIFIGFLLMTQRYRTIGAVMMLPMLANILMITVSQNWHGTPWILATLLLINLFLLLMDLPKFLPLLSDRQGYIPTGHRAHTWKGTLSWSVGLALVFISIPVSHQWLVASYVLTGSGVLLAAFSRKLD